MKKEEIIDILKYIDSENLVIKPSTYADIAESYLSIISTRRSERRADGSNSKAKEVCTNCGELKSKHSKVTMLCPTIFAHYKQTD